MTRALNWMKKEMEEQGEMQEEVKLSIKSEYFTSCFFLYQRRGYTVHEEK